MSSNHVLELVEEAFAALGILVMVPAYLLSGFWMIDLLMLAVAPAPDA